MLVSHEENCSPISGWKQQVNFFAILPLLVYPETSQLLLWEDGLCIRFPWLLYQITTNMAAWSNRAIWLQKSAEGADRGSRGGSHPSLVQLPVSAHIPWLMTTSPQAPSPWSPYPLFCHFYLCLCLHLLKTATGGFRTYPDNPRKSLHPEILNHFCKVFGTEGTIPRF